jgi:hypothetical protein
MAEVIAVSVFEHEVEVLKDIHGESNVEIVDGLADEAPVEIEAGEEFDRLNQYYGTSDTGQSYAERVFGRTARGLEAFAYRPKKAGKAAPVEAE